MKMIKMRNIFAVVLLSSFWLGCSSRPASPDINLGESGLSSVTVKLPSAAEISYDALSFSLYAVDLSGKAVEDGFSYEVDRKISGPSDVNLETKVKPGNYKVSLALLSSESTVVSSAFCREDVYKSVNEQVHKIQGRTFDLKIFLCGKGQEKPVETGDVKVGIDAVIVDEAPSSTDKPSMDKSSNMDKPGMDNPGASQPNPVQPAPTGSTPMPDSKTSPAFVPSKGINLLDFDLSPAGKRYLIEPVSSQAKVSFPSESECSAVIVGLKLVEVKVVYHDTASAAVVLYPLSDESCGSVSGLISLADIVVVREQG